MTFAFFELRVYLFIMILFWMAQETQKEHSERIEGWLYFKDDCLFKRILLATSKNISKRTHAITDVIINLTHRCQRPQPLQIFVLFFFFSFDSSSWIRPVEKLFSQWHPRWWSRFVCHGNNYIGTDILFGALSEKPYIFFRNLLCNVHHNYFTTVDLQKMKMLILFHWIYLFDKQKKNETN